MKKLIITALTFILFFLMKEIRVLSALQVKRQNDLIEEAIKDLLKKYQNLEPSPGVSMAEEF